jgi:hypothetical protein
MRALMTADEIFDFAYEKAVVDGDTAEAIRLCREALSKVEDHFRVRVFLGTLLGDAGDEDGAKAQFVAAIKQASPRVFCTSWPEEKALYHLALSMERTSDPRCAILLYLMNYLVLAILNLGKGLIDLPHSNAHLWVHS